MGNRILIYAVFLLLLFSYKSKAQTPVRNNEGYILINYNGDVLTLTAYDFIGQTADYYHMAAKNELWGYLKNNGQEAIALQYDVVYPFNGEFALVGLHGHYYHINRSNTRMLTIDWPAAPIVYNQNMLFDSSTQKVYLSNGETILASKHQLIFAQKSGIIEWRKNVDSVYQYIARPGGQTLIKAKGFANVDSVIITQQGYVCLVKLSDEGKFYEVYDERAALVVNMPAEGNHPNYIRTVWDKYVYWPNGIVFSRGLMYGEEVHYPMKYLSPKGQSNMSPLPFQLCDYYADDKVVMMPNTDKWIQFDGREIAGTRIFDDVRKGDGRYMPVRIDSKWYILDKREDTLSTTPFRDIHPIGMSNGRFFASTQNVNRGEEKWAFVNLPKGIITKEKYDVALQTTVGEFIIANVAEMYHWQPSLNAVMLDGKKAFINNQGEIIWTNPATKPFEVADFFGVDFEFPSRDYKALPKKHGFARNKLTLHINSVSNGVDITLANTAKTPKIVEIQDGRFRAKFEYKNQEGEWVVIAALAPSWCGNSYYSAEIPAAKMANTHISIPAGSANMQVRVTLLVDHEETIISNEITIKTNAARLWVTKYEHGFGAAHRFGR